MSTPKSTQRERFGAYAKTALGILGITVGVVALAAFPGLAVVAKEFTRHKRKYSQQAMRGTLYRLRTRGYVYIVKKDEELILHLTAKGKRALKKLRLENLAISRPARWDGRWRFVAFDIPEKKRGLRSAFRKKLEELGFVKIEKSLFAHPHPCTTEVALLVDCLGIGSFVHHIEALTFNGEWRWRTHFQLPPKPKG